MNMKKWKLIIMVIWGMLFASCEQSDPQLEETSNEVHFVIHQSPMSRSGKELFNIGDSIGIFAVKRTNPNQIAVPGTAGNQTHNAKWIKTETGWMPASPFDKVIWAQDGTPIDFYAYYPYSREAVNPEAIVLSVSATQNVASLFEASDALRAANTQGLTGGDVDLWFEHLFALVDVNLKSETFTISSDMKVTARNVCTAVQLNLGTGVQTPMGTGNVTLHSVNEDGKMWHGILPPQEIAADHKLLQCEQSGEVFIYGASAVSLTSGSRQKFEINLKQ